MAKFLLLLYGAPDAGPAQGSPEAEAEMGAWWGVTDELGKSGAMLGGEALQPVETATTLRLRDGEELVTDGPFAETKEQLGGFYLVDVEDLDAALAWARKMPNAPYGSIEVRPIMEFETE